VGGVIDHTSHFPRIGVVHALVPVHMRLMTIKINAMKCPNCEETLVMSDRQGIEIDYCPKCRGVWLDRGELDKIIERSVTVQDKGSSAQPSVRPVIDREDHFEKDRDDYRPRPGYDPYYKKRKKGFLGDLFDFD
jgi:Zn-finger nucleic acid-binding protein